MVTFLTISVIYFGINYILNPEPYTIQDNCLSCNKIYGVKDTYYSSDYLEMLNRIKKDCGSTHFVYRDFDYKDGLDDEEWRVFTNDCKNSYCKTVYVKLEDCLK